MAILLKTASVRVSSIQIMQFRVQNKGKSVWKSRYDGDESPSPEPRTDSRSTLPRKIRAWGRLRIVKRDESFSLIFFLPVREYIELELRSVEVQGTHEVGGTPQGGACTIVDRVWVPIC